MKKILSLVIAFAMVAMTATTAFAVGVEEALILPTDEISSFSLEDDTLISAEDVYFICDEDGNLIDICKGDIPAVYKNTASSDLSGYSKATLKFYKSGSSYYVSLEASVVKNNWWFTKSKLQIRPKGNTNWTTHETPYETKPTSITDKISFYYPNGEPDDVSVEVKLSYSLSGEGFLEKAYALPNSITLDNP